AAVVALVMSSLAVIVVVSRGDGGSAPAGAGSGVASSGTASSGTASSGSASAAKDPAAAPALPPARRVAAADIVRLRRESVALVRDVGRTVGVRVTDEDLRKA